MVGPSRANSSEVVSHLDPQKPGCLSALLPKKGLARTSNGCSVCTWGFVKQNNAGTTAKKQQEDNGNK